MEKMQHSAMVVHEAEVAYDDDVYLTTTRQPAVIYIRELNQFRKIFVT